MADENTQDIQEAYRIKVEKAIALARTTSPDQLGSLNKMVEMQTNGLWSVEDENFRRVFDEWYKDFFETLSEPSQMIVEGKRQTQDSSKPIEQDTLNEWDQIAQNASRAKARVAKKNRDRRIVFEQQLQEAKTTEEKERAKKLLEQNELATKTSLQEASLHGSVRPDTLKAILDSEAEKNPEKNFDLQRSIKKARILDVFVDNTSNERDTSTDHSSLFRALAEEKGGVPFKKQTATYLDSLMDGLSPEDKENVKQHLFKKAFEKIVDNSQQLTDKVGSEAAQTIVTNLKTQLASSSELPSLHGASSIVNSVGNTVFGPTIQNDVAEMLALENSAGTLLQPTAQATFAGAQATAGAETQVLVNGVFVTGKINTAAIETAVVQSRLPFEFTLFASQGGRLAGASLGASGAGATTGAVGGKVAGGFLRKFLAGLGIKAGATAAGSAIGGTTGAALGTTAGGPAGTVIGFIGGSLVVPAWNAFKKGVGAFFTGKLIPFFSDGINAVQSYFGNGLPPAKKDNAWLVFAGLVLFPVLIVMGITNNQTTALRGSALVTSVGGGGYIPGMAIDCEKTPNDPRCSMTACNPAIQECRWPTTGSITQGPFTSCGNTSHRAANAIDIGAVVGTDVYATTTGTVTSVYVGCTDNTGFIGSSCGGGYGNSITIKTNAGYTLKFGHLSQGSICVSVGQTITNPNTVIAEVDQNGNSSGSHLHFELIGSVGINSILPVAVGHCANGTPGCPPCNTTTQ
jgi:hypothetical protein